MNAKYRPSSRGEAAAEEGNEASRIPGGVLWLSFGAGLLFLVMGARSAQEDFKQVSKLMHLSSYQVMPARWLKVAVRRDTSESLDDHYPDILFEYFPNGQSVWGWRLSYEDLPRPKSYWDMRLKPYKVGDTVTVFWDGEHVQDCIVERKSDGLTRPLLKVAMGIAFALVGAVLTLIPVFSWFGKFFKK